VPAFVVDGQVLAAGVQSADRLLELLSGGSGFKELPVI
jgi:predicted DsbA family dithiol-disulfide isomerase